MGIERVAQYSVGQNIKDGCFKCSYIWLVTDDWACAKEANTSLSDLFISGRISSNSNANALQPKEDT